MKVEAAPADAWEVRVSWGARRLAAEVLDARGKQRLTLGDRPGDDFATGTPARLRFQFREGRLDIVLSGGVTGAVSVRGDAPAPLGQLEQRGILSESPAGFALTLERADSATFDVGPLRVDVRQARARFPRLPFDARTLVPLLLALIAIGVLAVAILAPDEGPRLHWLKRP